MYGTRENKFMIHAHGHAVHSLICVEITNIIIGLSSSQAEQTPQRRGKTLCSKAGEST
jgi:hypothetical protein